MARKTSLLLIVALLMLLLGTRTLVTAAATQESAQSPEKQTVAQNAEKQTVAQKCLSCHGSFDKLAEKTANYKTSSGETVTPHQYIPHAEKTDIPECTECHVPHTVPLQDKSTVVKPDNITFCFTSCHHANNLQPCKNCH